MLVFGTRQCDSTEIPPTGVVTVAVRKVYFVINDVSLRRASNGVEVPVNSLSLSLDTSSWSWGFDAVLPHRAQSLIEPNGSGVVELLAEREELLTHIGEVELPVRIPASRFKDYVTDMAAVAETLARPMPPKPYAATRAGTLFHEWVEANYAVAGEIEDEQRLGIAALQETFKASRWAGLTPISVEQEIHLTVGAHTFICKLDAVFATDDGVEIIDWKTGQAPVDESDEELKSLQLALYRVAYSRFTGMPIEKIEASLFFVSESKEIKPKRLLGEAELLDLWQKAIEAV
jgi:DNA helicase-2/ATP-dependent DNA helicase PcrA